MNIKKLIKTVGVKLLDDKATKVAGSIFGVGSVFADITYAMRVDGFQLHDLFPLFTLEGLGAIGFLLLFGLNRKANKRKAK